MKIAFVGHRGIPASFGGVEKHVEVLGSRLAARGHEVITYTRRNYNKFNGNYMGIHVKSLFAIPEKHTEMISHTFLSLLDLLEHKVDIIHFHSVDPTLLSFMPRMYCKAIVATSHGQAYRRGKWGPIAKRMSKYAERAFVKFPHRRIAVSRTLQKYYQQKYDIAVDYIPNGVELRNIQETLAIDNLGLKKNNYILFVGRLIPTKGCDTLIKAYNRLDTSKKLVVVGGSSYTDTYVKMLHDIANEKVVFVGFKYGDELAQLYAHAYCYVMPSEIEGLAITLLEAMSYGKCVVYSDIPENEEVAKDVGISFKNESIDDCARAIEYAVNNYEYCQSIGTQAQQKVANEYDWDKIVLQTEKLYRDLLK